jgi:acyl-CoA synthetase (AMP-forming)/AMP-acid ligase II
LNLRQFLEKQVRKYSHKIFLYFEEEKITYQDFNMVVNRIGNGFRKIGIKKGDRVAIMLPNSPAFLYTWMGLAKIGAVEVPLNINFKEEEIKYILQHSESVGIVIHRDYYPRLSGINKELPDLQAIVFYGNGPIPGGTIPFYKLLEEGDELPQEFIPEDDPAVLLYTSGTTDRPKGVLHSHKNWVLIGEAYAYMVGLNPEDRLMTSNPLFHANAQVYATMGTLAAGASLILLGRFTASKIWELARHYGATRLALIQAVIPWIWNQPPREDDEQNPVKSVIGTAPKELYSDFERRFQVKIQSLYSLTEAPLGIMGPREGTKPRKHGGIGVPMEHPDPSVKNEVMLVDDQGRKVNPGQKGEILIRNPATMIGYWKDPEKTISTKRNGWVYTGDLGYQDEDGYYFFAGRKKEVIRRRGELISPQEIESVLNAHPKIIESAVLGISSGLGTGEEEVKAFIRLKPGEILEPEEIIYWCKTKLAEFKVPSLVEFRNDFPKNALGRIQKSLLLEEEKTSEMKR